MNEQTQKELATWLSSIREWASQMKDFALDQAPAVVKEVVAFGRAEYTAVMVLIVAAIVGGFYALRWLSKWCKTIDGEPLSCFAWAGYMVVGPILLVTQGQWFLMAWFAPRLYVLECLASLIGRASGK
jgi:hypothetical protein